jgi:glycosyltransferase involved in cell wall biosynthesis
MPPILVSVIVPTKDRHDTLVEALDSIAAQSIPHFEAIIVNDGGASPRATIAKNYPDDARFRLIDCPTSSGPAAARNRGLAACQGDIITYLDDDDLFLPGHFAAICAVLGPIDAKPVAYTRAEIIHYRHTANGYQEERKAIQPHRAFGYRKLLSENHIPLICLAHKATRYKDVGGFREDFDQLEDWELILRLTKDVGATPIDQVTAVYRHLGQRQHVNSVRDNALEIIENIYALHGDVGHVQLRRARYSYLQRIALMLRTQRRLGAPYNVEAKLREISNFLSKGTTQPAGDSLRRLVTDLPDDGELRLLMARVLRAQNLQIEAEEEIRQVQLRDPYAQPTPSGDALPTWG